MGELRCAKSACLPFVLNAAQRCVRRHAGHVTERPRLGFPFARSAAAEVNYSCVQMEHAILRRHPITGAIQKGNSVTHSVADATRNWCFDSGRPRTATLSAILTLYLVWRSATWSQKRPLCWMELSARGYKHFKTRKHALPRVRTRTYE